MLRLIFFISLNTLCFLSFGQRQAYFELDTLNAEHLTYGSIDSIDLNSIDQSSDSAIIFNMTDPAHSFENVHLSLSATRASSSSDNVEFASKDIERDSTEPLEFLLIVGSQSAVLTVDGKVVAGTRLGQQAQLSVAVKAGQPQLSNLRIDSSPELDGCPNS